MHIGNEGSDDINNSSGSASSNAQEINELFNRLDLNGKGAITLEEFSKSIRKTHTGHSEAIEQNGKVRGLSCNLSELLTNYSDEIVKELFDRIDIDHDKVISQKDFETYYNNTEAQIKLGFQKIDSDKDGLIKSTDILKYLDTLSVNPMKGKKGGSKNGSLDEKEQQGKKDSDLQVRNDFIQWAFGAQSSQGDNAQSSTSPAQGITYNDFKLFLLFVPRNDGSRLKTAFNHYYYEYFLNKNDLDLSSDSDIIYINNSLKFFLAGGTSGVISRSCTAPLDRIKVFLIANQKNLHITEVIRQIYKKGGGWRSFYVGNGLNSLKVFPESSIKFGSFELVKKLCFGNDSENPLVPYICGGIAGVMAQLSVYPIDTIKYRMQCENLKQPVASNGAPHTGGGGATCSSQGKPQKHIFKIVKEVYQINGIRTFYRGLNAGLMGMFPYAAIDLGTFNLMKNFFLNKMAAEQGVRKEDVQLPTYVLLPMGAFSGSIGATVVYPINLLRTRLQAQGTFAHPYTYDGFFDCAKKTVIREGYRGLFKGLVPNLAKVCPAVSISYFCYENFKKILKIDNSS